MGPPGAGSIEGATLDVVPAQALWAAPDGVLAREVVAHQDVRPGAGAPPRLLGQLQGEVIDADDIVVAHHALGFVREELLEVHRVPEGDEGDGRIGRGWLNCAL